MFNKENLSQEFEPIQVLRPQFGTLDEIQWNMPTTWLLQMGSQGKEVRVSISKVKNNVNVSGEGQSRAFFRMGFVSLPSGPYLLTKKEVVFMSLFSGP